MGDASSQGWLLTGNFAKTTANPILKDRCEKSMRTLSQFIAALFLAGVALPLASAGAQDAAGSADYDKRIQRLEEQIVDLSAQLGTVETMGQGGGAAASAGGGFSGGGSGGGEDGGRVSEIETQVRALSAQLTETLRRLERLEQRSGGLAPADQPGGATETARASKQQPASRYSAEQSEQGTGFSVGGEDKESNGFGVTVEPGQGKSGGRADSGGAPDGISAGNAAPVRTAASSSPQARALYEQSYNALVQRNYRAAEDGFEQFSQSYPTDPLAGSAFFWLGEAAFTSGEYRKAADSFLKSSTNYPQNEKAAESLLKLGISLKRLGENKAACSSFAELARRFPSATPVLQRAEREKSRAQC
jgi:tol-pal system protein YbgF